MILAVCGLALPVKALEPWQAVLSMMPLTAGSTPLNRDNCIPVILGAFRSNTVVKAILFLPAVSDDFYLLNRDALKLNIAARNLLEAVTALTNRTAVRITFRPPFLLLHLERDMTEPAFSIESALTARKLQASKPWPHMLFNDRHWEKLQPTLEQKLGIKILPKAGAEDAWHFARHNVAGWQLTDWETLVALSLTGKTEFIVKKDRVMFRERAVTGSGSR